MTSLDSASLKVWESVAEWGFRMVFIGVAGEGAEIIAKLFFKKSFKKNEHSWDIFSGICWLILVVGLAIEFKGTHNVTRFSDAENARLTNEAANTESNNLVLRSKVVVLELKLQPRTISDTNILKFISLLKDAPKGKVRIVYAATGNEIRNYIDQIRGMLDRAGYGTGDPESVEFKPGVSVNHAYDSGVVILVNNQENAPPYFGPIQQAFTTIGITTFGFITNDKKSTYKVQPGEMEIFVTEKP